MSELDDLKDRVAVACRVLAGLGLTREPAGHVSARVPGTDTVLIKARGRDESGVRYTGPDDVITVDMNGKKLDGSEGQATPQEVFIHTWLYKTRPDVNSVIHIHPPTVVLFTICDKPLLPVYGAYDPASLRLWLNGIPNFDKSVLVSNDALGEELAKTMGDKSVCLMRGHGITSCAADVETAAMEAILLNELAEMNYKAALLGTPRPISDEDLEVFRARGERAGRTGSSAAWKTYRRIVGA
jgi:ribulose-5-phosphate 4-epimerase/fuculose-1-phosphate aldolase